MPAKELRHLLLLSLDDPHSPYAWSGTSFNLRLALERQVDRVTVVGSLKPKRTLIHGALRLFLGGRPPRYPLYLAAPAQREFARIAEEAIRQHQPDAVLSVSSHFLVQMKEFRLPTFMFSDAPWITYKQVYRLFEPTPLPGRRFAVQEAEAARRCTGVIFPSRWAASEAERQYALSPSRIHVIPIGANFQPRISPAEIARNVENRPTDRLDLLYVGKDWLRKGGPFALEIAAELRKAGIPGVRLHIVGCRPTLPAAVQDMVQVHGPLRMSDPADRERMESLFLHSHFLVVPTTAECFGVVFAEAQAFGLPPVSRAVQAVPEIVLDGRTGLLGSLGASAESYAVRLAALFEDPPRYQRMAKAAMQHYENKLHWDRFGERVVKLIQESMQPGDYRSFAGRLGNSTTARNVHLR